MKKIAGIVALLLLMMLPLLPGKEHFLTLRSEALGLMGETGSEQVIQGKEGFLFFTESLERAMRPITEDELRLLSARLTALEAALQREGRRLLVLIAPDKRSVYPEMLPRRWQTKTDNLGVLIDALEKEGIETVNVLEALRAEKETGPVYFPGDTHWNARGAWAVYRLLSRQIGLENAEDYRDMAFQPGKAGDLIRLCRPALSDTEEDATPVLQRSYRTIRPFASLDAMKIETACDRNERSLLVIRDSFGKGLFPYLAENAGRMTYSRKYEGIPAQAAEAEADTVLLEIVERDAAKLIEYLSE